MSVWHALWRNRAASTAAEFGLVTPLLITFMIGTVDVGRFLWTCNRAEKATQMGTRFAVATDIVPTGLATYDFATSGGILQGNPIPTTSFGSATCTSTAGTVSCTCDTGQTCPTLTPVSSTAFANILARMQQFYPNITASNVVINYQNSGIGYAGDPNGIQVTPLVTIKLTGMQFTPLLFRFFGNATVNLPQFSAALTLEDGSGTYAN